MGFRDDVEVLKARRETLRHKRQKYPRDPRWEAEWTALRQEIDATRTELAKTLLERTRIAKPCRADWYTMAGGDHVRECGRCDKRVYELSGLTAVEAAQLLTGADGELCVRLYRRSDGTVMTSDCQERSKRRLHRSLRVLGAAAGLAACVATGQALAEEVSRVESGHLARDGDYVMGEAPYLSEDEREPGLMGRASYPEVERDDTAAELAADLEELQRMGD